MRRIWSYSLKRHLPLFGFSKSGRCFFLDQTHDAEDDGRENCREYAVGDQAEAGEGTIFSPVLHRSRSSYGMGSGPHAETLCDRTFHTTDLQYAETGDSTEQTNDYHNGRRERGNTAKGATHFHGDGRRHTRRGERK